MTTEKQKRWTLPQALEEFRTKFPLGFSDPAYLIKRGERDDKLAAHELFVEQLGEGKGQKLLDENNITEITQRALAVVSKSKMLLSYESVAFADALKNQPAAIRFYKALFALLDSPVVTEKVYQSYIDAALGLPQEDGKAKVTIWPIVSLLPFIAQPEKHMFLKPRNAQAAAEALDFDLHYQPLPNWQTYKALLDMTKVCFYEIKHLTPRDFIDVQSFMWLACN
jgi:hypothetical protein